MFYVELWRILDFFTYLGALNPNCLLGIENASAAANNARIATATLILMEMNKLVFMFWYCNIMEDNNFDGKIFPHTFFRPQLQH